MGNRLIENIGECAGTKEQRDQMVDRVCTLHAQYGVGGMNYALVEYLVEEVFKLQQRIDELENKGDKSE